jgi:hypothetical protein
MAFTQTRLVVDDPLCVTWRDDYTQALHPPDPHTSTTTARDWHASEVKAAGNLGRRTGPWSHPRRTF